MGDRYITLVYLSILTALLISEVTCKVRDDCTLNTDCGGDPAGYQCDGSKKCQCTTDYYEDAAQACVLKLGHDIDCTESTQCNDNLGLICIDDGTGTNKKCLCDTPQYYNSTQCVNKGGYGDGCTTVDSCSVENTGCYTVNNVSTCSCNPNYYTDNNQCKSVDELKPTGITRGTSTSSSVTISWSVPQKAAVISFNIKGTGPNISTSVTDETTRTYTVTGLTPNTQYTAVTVETVVKTDRNPSLVVTSDESLPTFITPKAGYREQCVATAADQCSVPDTECINLNDGNGSKCYCQVGYKYNTNNNQCFNAVNLKPTYNGADPKTTSATVRWILQVPSNSQLISSFTIEANGTKMKENIGNTTTSSEITNLQPDTTYNIVILAIVNTDRNSNYEVRSDQVTIITKQETGGSCDMNNDNIQCTGNLTCINSQCRCPSDQYLFNDYCYPKLEYGGDCSNSNDACKGDLLCYNDGSISRCKCESKRYWNSNECKLVSELKPTSFEVTDSTKSSLTFSWNIPSDTYISSYVISGDGDNFQNTSITNTARTGTVTGLSPGTDYTNIKITAQVITGRGNTVDDAVSDTILTDYTRSDPVHDLSITDIKSRGLTVSWSYHEKDSGPLTAYILDVKRNGNECVQQFVYLSDIDNKPTTDTCEGKLQNDIATTLTAGVRQEITDLLPYTNYTLTVTPYNEHGLGSENSETKLTATEEPILPKEEDKILIPKTGGSVGQTSFSVTICASCLKDDTNGPIKLTAILVCVKDKCDINDYELTVDDIKKFSNWKTAKAASFNSPYRVTNDTWSGGKNEVTIVIGEESESVCEKQAERYFCNGPLNMDTEYRIIAVSCTDGGCTFSKELGSFRTSDTPDDGVSPLVAGIIGALLGIILMVIGFLIYCVIKRRRSKQRKTNEGSATYTSPSNARTNPDRSGQVSLRRPNNDLETTAYYVNVPERSNNGHVEQGPYASLNDNFTPPVYETLN